MPEVKHDRCPVRIGALACLTTAGCAGPAGAQDYEFESVYTGDVLWLTAGGLDRGSSYLDNLDLKITGDLDRVFRAGSGEVHVHAIYNNETGFSDERVGDLQVVSNIDTRRGLRLFEFWYEFGRNAWSVRSGLYDLNSEFDTHETGGLFLNSSHGIGAELAQTGERGPSIFPEPEWAIRTDYATDRATFRLAAVDGGPGDDGILTIGELDIDLGSRWRLWSGVWRYSGRFGRLDSLERENGNRGVYVGAEWSGERGRRPVGAFVRYGTANERFNALDAYFGSGIVVGGLIQRRPNDEFGIAVAVAQAGKPYRDNLASNELTAQPAEQTWELTYRARISDWLAVQPTIQLVRNPAASDTIEDALVVGVRIELTWAHKQDSALR